MKKQLTPGFLYLIFSFLSLTVIVSCSETRKRRDTSTDPQALKLVATAIEKSGGLDRWQNIETLAFKKKTRTYDSAGRIITDREELVEFGFGDKFYGIMTWMQNDDLYRLEHHPGKTVLFKNNQALMSESWSLIEKINAAIYTVGMPYKLMDEGNSFSIVEVNDSTFHQPAFKMKVKTEGSDDIWWYYFGKKDQGFLGSMVYHHPNYALIVNESFVNVEGLKFVGKRKSFRVDKDGNKKHLVAEYLYYDYEIIFKHNN